MGGIGSGRPRRGGRQTVESCASIDVNRLRREDRLRPGVATMVTLSPSVENMIVFADADSLRFLRSALVNGRVKRVWQTVGLDQRSCNLGGKRAYFVCFGYGEGSSACGRRVAKLYASARHFLCRHCLALGYASQNQDAWGRAQLRAFKTRSRITADTDINAPLPLVKPKRMHWRTFSRLCAEAKAAQQRAHEAFILDAEKFWGPLEG